MSFKIGNEYWTNYSQNSQVEYKNRCITSPFSRKFIEVLASNINLISIDLEGCIFQSDFTGNLLRVVTKLQTLSMKCAKFNASEALQFIDAIATNTSVTSLSLDTCNFEDDSPALITALIATNTALKTLNLSYGRINGIHFAKTFASNFTLSSIDLTGTHMSDAAIKFLAVSLKTNQSLETLNLAANHIFNNGAIALANALKYNTVLTTLNLENNNIGFEGAGAFYFATALRTLNLTGNEIRAEGAIRLLKANTSLTSLSLLACRLTDDAGGFIQVLESNTTLTSLNLSFTDINIANVLPLIRANTTLTTLGLRDQMLNISNKSFLDLLTNLQINPSITSINTPSQKRQQYEINIITHRNRYNQKRRFCTLFRLLYKSAIAFPIERTIINRRVMKELSDD